MPKLQPHLARLVIARRGCITRSAERVSVRFLSHGLTAGG
jgi:hypothetical protein